MKQRVPGKQRQPRDRLDDSGLEFPNRQRMNVPGDPQPEGPSSLGNTPEFAEASVRLRETLRTVVGKPVPLIEKRLALPHLPGLAGYLTVLVKADRQGKATPGTARKGEETEQWCQRLHDFKGSAVATLNLAHVGQRIPRVCADPHAVSYTHLPLPTI